MRWSAVPIKYYINHRIGVLKWKIIEMNDRCVKNCRLSRKRIDKIIELLDKIKVNLK